MSEESAARANPHHFMGVAREEIDWYPTIDHEKCTDCGDCAKFCAHEVYVVDEAGKVTVANPKNCVVFCQACLKMCPVEGAVIFQPKKDVLQQIKQIKAGAKASNGD